MKHVIHFSGGAMSWATAKRVAETHGTSDLVLLFADTLIEDADLYRFNADVEKNIGVKITRVCDGRTPFQIFRDERFLGNSRIDPCSKLLKRELLDRWCDENLDRANTTRYFGLDWSEAHRFHGKPGKPGLKDRMAAKGWRAECPMISQRPLLTKLGVLNWLASEGIEVPRLYKLGLPHNNCGGGCIKAGKAHWLHVLNVLPEVYDRWEREELAIREYLGRDDISILTEQRQGVEYCITLRELRERAEKNIAYLPFEAEEWGGCGCAV